MNELNKVDFKFILIKTRLKGKFNHSKKKKNESCLIVNDFFISKKILIK